MDSCPLSHAPTILFCTKASFAFVIYINHFVHSYYYFSFFFLVKLFWSVSTSPSVHLFTCIRVNNWKVLLHTAAHCISNFKELYTQHSNAYTQCARVVLWIFSTIKLVLVVIMPWSFIRFHGQIGFLLQRKQQQRCRRRQRQQHHTPTKIINDMSDKKKNFLFSKLHKCL